MLSFCTGIINLKTWRKETPGSPSQGTPFDDRSRSCRHGARLAALSHKKSLLPVQLSEGTNTQMYSRFHPSSRKNLFCASSELFIKTFMNPSKLPPDSHLWLITRPAGVIGATQSWSSTRGRLKMFPAFHLSLEVFLRSTGLFNVLSEVHHIIYFPEFQGDICFFSENPAGVYNSRPHRMEIACVFRAVVSSPVRLIMSVPGTQSLSKGYSLRPARP